VHTGSVLSVPPVCTQCASSVHSVHSVHSVQLCTNCYKERQVCTNCTEKLCAHAQMSMKFILLFVCAHLSPKIVKPHSTIIGQSWMLIRTKKQTRLATCTHMNPRHAGGPRRLVVKPGVCGDKRFCASPPPESTQSSCKPPASALHRDRCQSRQLQDYLFSPCQLYCNVAAKSLVGIRTGCEFRTSCTKHRAVACSFGTFLLFTWNLSQSALCAQSAQRKSVHKLL
jgi:hypothetical protein